MLPNPNRHRNRPKKVSPWAQDVKHLIRMNAKRTIRLTGLLIALLAFSSGCGQHPDKTPSSAGRSVALVFPVMVDAFKDFKREFEAEAQQDDIKVATFSA